MESISRKGEYYGEDAAPSPLAIWQQLMALKRALKQRSKAAEALLFARGIKELCKMQACTTGKDKHVLTRQVLQKLSVNLQREIADELVARRPILPAHVDGEI